MRSACLEPTSRPLASSHTGSVSVQCASVLATAGSGDLDLHRADEVLAGPTAWLFGNEARGLTDEELARADRPVRLPIYGRAESLNLATAASVCLYESAFAQRS